MKESIVENMSFEFAIRIVKAYKHLAEKKGERILSKQLLRSGTAIGALVSEAVCAETKKDFIHKMGIARKESRETNYWIRLLIATDYLTPRSANNLMESSKELFKILSSIVLTSKQNLHTKNKKHS